jgi:transposase
MDVHKNSFNLCALDGHTGEILAETQCSSDAKNVLKFTSHVKEQIEDDVIVKVGYEAGCLGYAPLPFFNIFRVTL